MYYSVIIATSNKRTDWLINRSLTSVYNQTKINKNDWKVYIIDDNEDRLEFPIIKKKVKSLRKYLELKSSEFPTIVVKNSRTPFMSGTGAWNTGIYLAHKGNPDGIVCILDDDDEYLPNHLADCLFAMKANTVAVFQRLLWINNDDTIMHVDLVKENLMSENFFIGNPGVQGSNMFFRTQTLIDIGGFDESLPNTTDRDLMIRYLEKFDINDIEVIERIGVHHHNHNSVKVNNNTILKHIGLELFYKKHKHKYSETAFNKSLLRAMKHFNYIPIEQIIICMPVKNAEKTIKKAINSVVQQINTKREIVLLIGLDSSTDDSKAIIENLALSNPNIVLLEVDFGKTYMNRNYLNEYARNNYPHCKLIGRLDADDVITDTHTISKIEKLYDETDFDVLICGNKQQKSGKVLEWQNKPSIELLDENYLLSQLKRMADGDPKSELPSCNTFMKPNIICSYPEKLSAEDHWFTVSLLLQKEKLNININENLIYSIYNIDGRSTSENKKDNSYINSRRQLYDFFKNKDRIQKAESILIANGITGLKYLGVGHEGVVFTDSESVFKVILPINATSFNYEFAYRRKSFFLNLSDKLKHLYSISLIEVNGTMIIKYPFEKSDLCYSYNEEEAISILTELWQQRIIIMDCKPDNLIRVNGQPKIVDLDGYEFSDNLFLNMCARMFLYANFYEKYEYSKFQKVKRSAINNFDIDELNGLRVFVNRVFSNIILKESSNIKPYNFEEEKYQEKIPQTENLENLFYAKIKENKYITGVFYDDVKLDKYNYFEPSNLRIAYKEITQIKYKVTLLIKTCPQDVNTITENVKHIVKQLAFPNSFYEIVVSIDTRDKNFLREYYSNGTLDGLIKKVSKLKENKVIDRFIVFDQEQTKDINKRWFNIESDASHTISNAPLAPQLYAFEHCFGDYILQMDSDVLIGRKDYSHSFLNDMVSEFNMNKNVVSVGFNIPNKVSNDYFGFSDGGFVPEVRMGLIHKQRIFGLLPLPNSIDHNGIPKLTWQRSLHQKQKETNYVSIRGGDHRSYYIHPQNYRKQEPYAWMNILDKVEQNIIPELQYGRFDVEGSLYDWSINKRSEKLIVVSCFRNVNISRFIRMWHSLISQDLDDFGIILLDDNSDNGLPLFIDTLIKPYADKVTFIKKRNRSPRIQNVYTAIHYYISNINSIIVMLDGDDALIGKSVLSTISNKYDAYDADVAVGRFHQTYRIQPSYRYPVDFSNPRKKGGNVWQHIKTFKKYLFDSIPLPYFKYSNNNLNLYSSKWLGTCDDYAFMVPIVEMASQPIQLDEINYYYERAYDERNANRNLKELCIAEILSKPSLSKDSVNRGRIKFKPNINKIEIDITYQCDLKCAGCNRSCTQAPTTESIEITKIEKFIEESVTTDKKWELINVLGGEPTLHSSFKEIIEMLHDHYILKHSPNTILQIVSNGYSERARNLCEEMRAKYKMVRIDYGSYKSDNAVKYFSPFNDAPVDDENFNDSNFKDGCWVTSYCGIGLNNNGYYACAVIGGIDRIRKKQYAIPTLQEISIEKLENQLQEFCKYCGNFKAYTDNFGNFIPRVEKEPFRNSISISWKELYQNYNENE
jgi:glycosyltransferase involved in cell wall biosynthesis